MSTDIDNHILQKYEVKKRLGKGAYGIVWKAIDRKTGDVVAVKKIFDAFRNQTDAQRTFREICFLQEFGNYDNVIKLLNVVKADNDKDIYLVFEFMDTDLHNVIKKGSILKDVHKRYVMYQLFKAIKYIHSGNVIHRDLKPSNVLLDRECFIKICDFGLARSVQRLTLEHGDPTLTDYVATRWYRAPEILLASPKYTKGVDMWSMGCILGEMLLGKPLFPGTSTLNQIERIMSVIPTPSRSDIDSIKSSYSTSLLDKTTMRSRRSLKDLLPDAPSDGLDLMMNLLQFNPDKRFSAEEALTHPYLAKFHNPSEELSLTYDVVPPVDDDVQLSVAEYRTKLYDSILQKKLDIRRQRRTLQELEATPAGKQDEKPPVETVAKQATSSPSRQTRPTKSAPINHARRRDVAHNSPNHTISAADAAKKSPQVNKARPISAQYDRKANHDILTRNNPNDKLHVTSNQMVPQQRPSASNKPASASRPGRRPANNSASGLTMASYTQSHATVSKSTLNAVQGLSLK
ncbi:extracellular signal-regulated kinase 2-like isoform X1 [Hydractinia symbiolongicarpus]|uniref:extracellular signal-regulated kinase 2-like isoform X1 n=1 Tax=Hydractinia symbiolongicarpus TaxID=13093 RepID=UPI00254DD9AE|nr:extracellular signal-regulated kinase 2-like isoform X1 [Hydractinia symbiolongicarpus]